MSLFEDKKNALLTFGQTYHCDTFVETGTAAGDMINALHPYFRKVYSIELANNYYRNAVQKFQHFEHIKILEGDSGQVIKDIIPLLSGNVLFYLDAHYSGGNTARGSKDTPIMEELKSILTAKCIKPIILIDDFKEFQNNSNYPRVAELKEYVSKFVTGTFDVIEPGIIVIIPNDLPLYWVNGHNFGDVLNPLLYKNLTGFDAIHSDQSPKILSIGSVMHFAKPGDIIWGSGCLSPDIPLQLDSTTRVLAVRGRLTADLLKGYGIEVSIFGDPSWLLPMFIKPSEQTDMIGFMPHYIDYGQVGKLPENVKLLNPATDPEQLIKEITSCKAIVSSSLHGIVVAEAYGIPATWVELSDLVGGNGFKFRDYYADKVLPQDWRKGYHWDAINQRPWKPSIGQLERLLEVCPFNLKENIMAKKPIKKPTEKPVEIPKKPVKITPIVKIPQEVIEITPVITTPHKQSDQSNQSGQGGK